MMATATPTATFSAPHFSPVSHLTQTTPTNCWQTAVACILNLPIDALPPQSEIEALPLKVLDGYGSYTNVLNGYLMKHHRLRYTTIQEHQFSSIIPSRPYHVMCGPTIRTEQHLQEGRPNVHHAVVGRFGSLVWDVHPSGAGLLKATSWGLFGRISTPDLLAFLQGIAAPDYQGKPPAVGKRLVYHCLCPACGLDEMRDRADAFKLLPYPPLRPSELL